MSLFTTEQYKAVADAINSNDATSAGNNRYQNILKLKAGNTYKLRFLPNMKDYSKSTFKFEKYSLNSLKTGKFVSCLSLATFSKPCPFGLEKYRLGKEGSPEEKAKVKRISWNRSWYINVYVVNDPTTPENNGTVKVLRMGKNLHDKFTSGLESYGPETIFNLSEKGVNFELKVVEKSFEKDGKTNTTVNYESSMFSLQTSLGLSEEKQKEIYDSVHELDKIEYVMTEDQLTNFWKEHFLNETVEESKPQEKKQETAKAPETPQKSETSSKPEDDDDFDIDEVIGQVSQGE